MKNWMESWGRGVNRYPSMDQPPRGYKCTGGKKKINDGHMLYSDSIRSVRKAAQLYNRWNLSTFTRNSITAKRFRNEIESS